MDRNTNIFYKMTRENENSTTELLCNIFRLKYLRDIILIYFGIPKEIIDEITQENITTQISNRDFGIPDIIIESRNCYYIIENKIRVNTKLQENQKSNYIKLMGKKKQEHKGYIFIIPEGYKHIKSINMMEKKYSKIIITRTWQDFLKYLNKMELYKDSPIIKESIEYFSNVILSSPVDNTLSKEEIDIFYNPFNMLYSFSLISKFYSLIESNEETFIKKLGKWFSPSDWADELTLKGKYLNYKGSQCIFYGFSLDLLNPINDSNNKFIFSICFSLEELKEKRIINKKYTYMEEENGWLYIKTDISYIINDNTGKKYFDELITVITDVFLHNIK